MYLVVKFYCYVIVYATCQVLLNVRTKVKKKNYATSRIVSLGRLWLHHTGILSTILVYFTFSHACWREHGDDDDDDDEIY